MSQLTHITYIKNLLAKHNFTFEKRLGQNFLINPSVCPRMAEMAGAGPDTGVLEIGPGIGVLTRELCERAKKVVAVEIDERLLPILGETMEQYSNLDIVQGDVLSIDLNAIIAGSFSECEETVLCANLPYYITTPVITHLLESRLPLKAVTVMVQKEAAIRLAAKPGTRECGAISAAIWYYSEPKVLFSVSAGSFIPAPNVDSAVVRMDIRKSPPVSVIDEKAFFKTVRAAFAQRRKTILNSISSSVGAGKETVEAAIKAAELSPMARAESLSMDEMAALADKLHLAGIL